MGAYDAIKERGLRIPCDIAVVGFDNLELIAATLRPSLTTMQLPHFEMGRWAVDYLIDIELPLDRQVKALSRGTRTKLALLLALCRGAELLILDEPTSGLDPAATEQVLQAIVAHAAGEGTTVLFSTHQIAEVDQIADRVAIIEGGRTVLAGELDELRERHRRVELVFDGDAPDVAFRSAGIVRVRRQGRVLRVLTREGAEALLEEARALSPVSAEVLPVTLQEIFLETVKGE
jgi:ABC-2 type transport system ATP-binding protein